MLLKRSHDPQGKHRIVARLQVGLTDDVATSETEMIIFVDIIYLVVCGGNHSAASLRHLNLGLLAVT
jgi:hypothetical protein